MEYSKLYQRISDHHYSKILNWAVKKTGNRVDGEDLAQEVLLQVFKAVAKEEQIEKLEHFIWKIAHFVWCNRLKSNARNKQKTTLNDSLWDGLDFVNDFAEREALNQELQKMRRRIADLSHQKRESLILYYLDGLSIKEVAVKLDIAVSAVKWHLFDARKIMKKELESMKNENSYVYRPGRLVLGLSGIPSRDPDTKKVNENLIRQNICLLCYKEAKTLDELASLTGIPKVYLEHDLHWLVEREFLSIDGTKYNTLFPIIGKRHRQEVGDLYLKKRAFYSDVIINHFKDNEDEIRAIGFYGCEFAMDKLIWSLLMLYLSYFSRSETIVTKLKKGSDRPIRKDGGKYYIIGNDFSDNQVLDANGFFTPNEWKDFYGICSDSCMEDQDEESYYWLGLYTFKEERFHPEIVRSTKKIQRNNWHNLHCSLLDETFDLDQLSEDDKEILAVSVQKKLVTKGEGRYDPNFPIFTKSQLSKLQETIFEPLLSVLAPQTDALISIISNMHARDMPKVSKGYINYFTYLDLWYSGIYTYLFAAQENRIYLPETSEEGTALTLVLIK